MCRCIIAFCVLCAVVGCTLDEKKASKSEANSSARERVVETSAAARSEDAPKEPVKIIDLFPDNFRIGQVGVLGQRNPDGKLRVQFKFSIEELMGPDEMRVRLRGAFDVPFIMRSPTKGLAEGIQVEFPGVWHVKETKMHFGRTYFVLEKIP